MQTNSSGTVTAERQYDAFGNVIASSGAWASQFGNAGRFGYQEDPDSGLKLLGHRYYDSSSGRFLTRDPIKDSRNWYGYCKNNPVDSVDPTGLVKIYAYYYYIAGIGVHFFLVIVDNQVRSPTYGQKWYISGYPEGDDWYKSGTPIVVEVKHESENPYDKGARVAEGYILVNDQSPVAPWLSQARRAKTAFDSVGHNYGLLGNNSNTVYWFMLYALGLLGQDATADWKRERSGQNPLISPGFHQPWGKMPRIDPFPTYTDRPGL